MLHVLKRIVLIIVGYVTAVLVGLISIVILYMILSNLPGAPDYFAALSLSPVVILVVSPVGLIVYGVVVYLTALPALAGALITEFFTVRSPWLHMLLSAAIGGGAFVYASPELVDTIEGTDWADLGIVLAGGIAAGAGYWLIAGRRAGFARPAPSSPLPDLAN